MPGVGIRQRAHLHLEQLLYQRRQAIEHGGDGEVFADIRLGHAKMRAPIQFLIVGDVPSLQRWRCFSASARRGCLATSALICLRGLYAAT